MKKKKRLFFNRWIIRLTKVWKFTPFGELFFRCLFFVLFSLFFFTLALSFFRLFLWNYPPFSHLSLSLSFFSLSLSFFSLSLSPCLCVTSSSLVFFFFFQPRGNIWNSLPLMIPGSWNSFENLRHSRRFHCWTRFHFFISASRYWEILILLIYLSFFDSWFWKTSFTLLAILIHGFSAEIQTCLPLFVAMVEPVQFQRNFRAVQEEISNTCVHLAANT